MNDHPDLGAAPEPEMVRPAEAGNAGRSPAEAPSAATRRQARRLIAELVDRPRSQARQMVELCLVSYLAGLEGSREEQALTEGQGREELRSLHTEAEKLMADGLNLEERNRRLTEQLADAELRRHKMLQNLQALESQKNAGLTAAGDLPQDRRGRGAGRSPFGRGRSGQLTKGPRDDVLSEEKLFSPY